MDTFPMVPEWLEKDLASGYYLTLHWTGEGGQAKEIRHCLEDSNARIRIVLRPFIEVEVTNVEESEPEVVVTTIPLESVAAIDVDTSEVHCGVDGEGAMAMEECEVLVPVSRWVRHPYKGLLRFTA